METSKRARLTVYLVSGAWSLALFMAGIKLPGVLPKVLGFLPTAIVGLFAIYDNWLWKKGPFLRFAKRPDLGGTWAGHFISIRDTDGSGEVVHDPVPMFLVIRQTYIGLNVTLLSEQSCSYSIAEDLRVRVGDQYVAHYQYSNTPELPLRPSSPEHSGGVKLSISGNQPRELAGEYWTNRSSRGTMFVSRLSHIHVGTWTEALALQQTIGAQ